jgi:hypothetical protein
MREHAIVKNCVQHRLIPDRTAAMSGEHSLFRLIAG